MSVHESDLEFSNMWDAMDYCREWSCPVIVHINGEKWKLYPSGTAINLTKKEEGK